jgi:hypothetical protein
LNAFSYDLDQDPGEQSSIAADAEGYALELQEMEELRQAYLKRMEQKVPKE